MIQNLVQLLQTADFKEDSFNIQVAKGLYKYTNKLSKIREQQERMKILKDRRKKNKE